MRLTLEEALELGASPHFAGEDEVAALEQGSGILQPELGEKIPQIGHADRAVAADVNAAEKGDVGCQGNRQLWGARQQPSSGSLLPRACAPVIATVRGPVRSLPFPQVFEQIIQRENVA